MPSRMPRQVFLQFARRRWAQAYREQNAERFVSLLPNDVAMRETGGEKGVAVDAWQAVFPQKIARVVDEGAVVPGPTHVRRPESHAARPKRVSELLRVAVEPRVFMTIARSLSSSAGDGSSRPVCGDISTMRVHDRPSAFARAARIIEGGSDKLRLIRPAPAPLRSIVVLVRIVVVVRIVAVALFFSGALVSFDNFVGERGCRLRRHCRNRGGPHSTGGALRFASLTTSSQIFSGVAIIDASAGAARGAARAGLNSVIPNRESVTIDLWALCRERWWRLAEPASPFRWPANPRLGLSFSTLCKIACGVAVTVTTGSGRAWSCAARPIATPGREFLAGALRPGLRRRAHPLARRSPPREDEVGEAADHVGEVLSPETRMFHRRRGGQERDQRIAKTIFADVLVAPPRP